ncbi:MAG: glycosyltransferase family 4 protein [Thermodesulfobacteriota bacterium]|nr:glycosyltransferase family 4 protein [Thermodesulfobacteriota bacterium]
MHTFLSLIIARWYHPDLVHIHAIGPSILTPFARLMGLRVVVTNHGPEYERDKWGRLAKIVLRLGERIGGIYANEVIVISSIIENIVRSKCKSNLIYNGVTLPHKSRKSDFLTQNGITPGKYILSVARFVPEKGLHDLIHAFKKSDYDYKLVLAGDSDHETEYSRNLKELLSTGRRIVLTGYITGESLNQLYSHARLFILPSYHEGLPIVLLEALSYGLSVLVSDIQPNKEVKLPKDRYFQCGNVEDLKSRMDWLLCSNFSENEMRKLHCMIEKKYNWNIIAMQTIDVYKKALGKGKN